MYLAILGLIAIFMFDIIKALHQSKQIIIKRIALVVILVILAIPLIDLPYFLKGGISKEIELSKEESFNKLFGAESRKAIVKIYKDSESHLYWTDGIDTTWLHFISLNEKTAIKYLPVTRLIIKMEQGEKVLYDHLDGSVIYMLALLGYILFREIAKGTFFKFSSS